MIAALWEGGVLEPDKLPYAVPDSGEFASHVFKPLICIDTIPIPVSATSPKREPCPDGSGLIELQVPTTPDSSQHFRAPDLVWLPDGGGFLVLLSSQNHVRRGTRPAFSYKWLQRFDLSGAAVGNPLNLCALLPDPVRNGKTGNVEGTTWFEEGKSVALVNDNKDPATVVIISISPSWPPPSAEICH